MTQLGDQFWNPRQTGTNLRLYNIEDKITKYWLAETEGIFP